MSEGTSPKPTHAGEEETWTIGKLLEASFGFFRDRGVESPRLSAELLLSHVLGCKRIALYTMYGDAVDDQHRAALRELVRRRAAGCPVAYLTGSKEFYGRPFHVSSDVLIPRPETELLIETVLDRSKKRGQVVEVDVEVEPATADQSDASLEEVSTHPQSEGEEFSSRKRLQIIPRPYERILDLGTGSGIIGLTLASEFPKSFVTMVDVSQAALDMAKRNAESLEIEDRSPRLSFLCGDLFAPIQESTSFDLIVSNPPYIRSDVVPTLEVTVRDYEPHLALDGGQAGLDLVEKIIKNAGKYLESDGELLIEIGSDQKEAVIALVDAEPDLELVAVHDDLARLPRLLHARKLT